MKKEDSFTEISCLWKQWKLSKISHSRMLSRIMEKTNLSDQEPRCRVKYRAMALKHFQEGLGYKVVAKKLNLSMYTVRDWYMLYQGGFFEPEMKRPGNCRENLLDSKTKEAIKIEYENGTTISSLSRKYGKCKASIRYLLKSNQN